MQTHLERFIRFLAAEKGLSTAYQLSVRQTLDCLLYTSDAADEL